jgi:hypothetical protein
MNTFSFNLILFAADRRSPSQRNRAVRSISIAASP